MDAVLSSTRPRSRYAEYAAVILAAVSLAYAAFIHYCVLRSPGAVEYREAAMPVLTEFLGHGGNPYLLKNLPLYTAVYGVAYNYVVLPLTWIMGGGFLPHRLVSGAFTLGSCGLVYWAIRRSGSARTAAFLGAVLLYLDLAARSTQNITPPALPESIIARPDGMGLFLFLASVLVPWRYAFSNRSLAASLGLSIAAFLTKPYFIFGLAIVAAYVFLFRSARRGLVFGLTGGLLFLATLGIGEMIGRCYLSIILWGNNNSAFFRSYPHLWNQVSLYGRSLPACILIAAIAAASWWKSPGDTPATPLLGGLAGRGIGRRVDFFAFGAVACLAVLLIKLGEHGGNSMLYFYQLLSPWLLTISLRWIGSPARWGSAWLWLLCVDFTLFLVSRPIIPADHSDVQAQWRSLLAGRKNAYVAPPLAWLAREQGLPVWDSGMSEYYMFAVQSSEYPPRKELKQRYDQYWDEVSQKLANQEFDVLVLPYSSNTPLFTFLKASLVQENYYLLEDQPFGLDWEEAMRGIIAVRKRDLPLLQQQQLQQQQQQEK